MQKGNIVRSPAGFVFATDTEGKMWDILLVVCLEYFDSASCFARMGVHLRDIWK